MLRLTSFADLAALGKPVHLALGVFDGVHLGHQAVIGRAVAARAAGGLAGVLTFDPNPLKVIAPSKAPSKLLASLDHKAAILGGFGVDLLLALPFDATMAAMAAEDFIGELVRAGAKTLVAGEDWRFGRGRAGDRGMLEKLASTGDFRFEAVPPVMMDGERISSTRIRQAIRDGNLSSAAAMLGRPYKVSGKVVQGRQLGRQLGFPTANLEKSEEQYPPDGVWAVWVRTAEGGCHPGVANLGIRPTVDEGERSLEVHLIEGGRDLYGQVLEVEWVAWLRGEQRFSSLDELKGAIARDAAAAGALLGQGA
ncbi:MAG: riboflavin biosynthesis protein RibF [Akkermansiaceae bacterium]|nr:riboflavin biosynthesis protein RibF [Akkermansiaceae bacterium]